MPDRPIIFSAPMIIALLAGRKTQTRWLAWRNEGETDPQAVPHPTSWQLVKPEDRFWVREGFGIFPRTSYALPKTISPDPDMAAYYRAGFDRSGKHQWRSPLHMPRWASRLTLTVTYVRVQRVQEISEEDARAEGLVDISGQFSPPNPFPMWWTHRDDSAPCAAGVDPWNGFAQLWKSLHGDSAWEHNPEVIAISFDIERRNIDA